MRVVGHWRARALRCQIAAAEASVWEEQGGAGFLRLDFCPDTQVGPGGGGGGGESGGGSGVWHGCRWGRVCVCVCVCAHTHTHLLPAVLSPPIEVNQLS